MSHGPLFEVQLRQLALAERLTAILEAPGDAFGKGTAVAGLDRLGTAHSASLGPVSSPSQEALRLVARYGVVPDEEQRSAVEALDQLPEPLRSHLAAAFAAFEAFADASRSWRGDVGTMDGTPGSRAMLATSLAEGPGAVELVKARWFLVKSAEAIGEDMRLTEVAGFSVDVFPVLSLDFSDEDDRYERDYVFLLDVGGNDTYLNNAGGSVIRDCSVCLVHPAAALMDFNGDDKYESGRPGGVNGGGYQGVGFLLDAEGSDSYLAGGAGTNGGGNNGAGFLLDVSGDDSYVAGGGGTNGGGADGTGELLDFGGDDSYLAGETATNGGGFLGMGMLFDASGNDVYVAENGGTNGGGDLGHGLLVDAAGNDTYRATSNMVNGGGSGALLDFGGDDTYVAGSSRTNGGGGDMGFLLDGAGSDKYTASFAGTNGGANVGFGALIDLMGDDVYRADYGGTNGGAADGFGMLFDGEGNDSYTATHNAVNGGARAPAGGLLVDGAGSDWYEDSEGGTGRDRSVVPKGVVGAQVDLPTP